MSGQDSPSDKPLVEPLTRREREILSLLAEGFSAPEIAESLTLAVSSVKSHIQHIYGKLDVRSKREALTRAQALGLLESAAGTPPLAAAQPSPRTAVTGVPAEKPAPPPSTNLPLQPTAFVGREQELAAIAELLANPACRLVTLVGPGGSGKTRLAIQAATQQRDAFSDGVVLVPLAPVGSPESLAGAISDALKVPLAGREDPQAALLGYLGAKQMLLVLDNCEHLLAGAGLFGEILRGAPRITLLATSRERLNLVGEWLFDVEGLPVPAQWRAGEAEGAAGLFMQSARRLRAGFAPSEADKAAVVRICQLVGGMPLAVELAAAWVRMLSCAEIAAEIEGSLGILAAESRDVPLRQQSMQAIYDHSWKLLSLEEQQAFPRLSVFRSGFQREAAEQVAQAGLRLLSALVDKSLVRANPNGRYELHELARQYAAEKLQAAGDAETAARRHLAYCVGLAERAAPELIGPHQAVWLVRLEAEHDNLRAALAWSQAAAETEMGLRLAGAVWRFWFLRGHLLEGEQWLRRMLELPHGAP
ncbi:MAG: LuxR C-terminal-related transcriptional regulator, partial [Anaerolineales bacterium]